MAKSGLWCAIACAALAGTAATAAPPVKLATVLADPGRPDADKARDADRKPAELVAFAGVKPGDKVAELAPGGGYFTRILSGAVGPKGKVYAVTSKPSESLQGIAKDHANVAIIGGEQARIPAPEPVDLVWTTNNYHDFKNAKVGDRDAASVVNAEAFRALKPGGIYLIADHEAGKGVGAGVTSTLHRIESGLVRKEVEAAGFKFVAESPLLRHPADDHSLRVQESGIRGKTDQFVLKFQKPKR